MLDMPPMDLTAPMDDPEEPETGSAVEPVMREHIVTAREDLPRVAMMYNVGVARLREVNNLGEDDTISPGQTLLIPISE